MYESVLKSRITCFGVHVPPSASADWTSGGSWRHASRSRRRLVDSSCCHNYRLWSNDERTHGRTHEKKNAFTMAFSLFPPPRYFFWLIFFSLSLVVSDHFSAGRVATQLIAGLDPLILRRSPASGTHTIAITERLREKPQSLFVLGKRQINNIINNNSSKKYLSSYLSFLCYIYIYKILRPTSASVNLVGVGGHFDGERTTNAFFSVFYRLPFTQRAVVETFDITVSVPRRLNERNTSSRLHLTRLSMAVHQAYNRFDMNSIQPTAVWT